MTIKYNQRTVAILIVCASAFAVSGIIAGRASSVSVEVFLDLSRESVGIAVRGDVDVLDHALSFPKSAAGVKVNWSEAKLSSPGKANIAPTVRSIDRGRVAWDRSKDIDVVENVTLTYFLRSDSIDPVAVDMHQASGVIEDRLGAVDLDLFLPWAIDEGVRIDVRLSTGASSSDAKLVSTPSRRFLVWHRDSVSLSNGQLSGALLQGGSTGVGSTMVNVAQQAAKAVNAKDLPYLIVDPTSPGGYVMVGGGVLIVRATSAGPRACMSLGSVIWRHAWSDLGSLEPLSLTNNILLHGSDYLGMAAVADPESLEAIRGRAIERYFHALAAAKIRPIPARPIGKENWHLLIPGLLAMMHAEVPESAWNHGGFLATMSALAQQGEEHDEVWINQLLPSFSPTLRSAISLGLVPVLESPAPEGATLDWFRSPKVLEVPSGHHITSTLDILAGAHIDQYIETCGCKTGQAGGLARRATVLEHAGAMCELRVDCGGFLAGIPLRELVGQAAAEAYAFLEAFGRLALDAITIAYEDVCAGLDRVLGPESPLRTLPLVCANLYPPPGSQPLPPYIVVVLGEIRVAVLGWLGTDLPTEQMLTFETGLAGWMVDEDLDSIRTVVSAAQEVSDAVVLIGDLEHRILRAHENALTGIDFVVTSDGSDPSESAFQKSYNAQRSRPAPYLVGKTVILSVPYGTSSLARFTDLGKEMRPLLVEQVVLDDSILPSTSIEPVISKLSLRFEVDVSAHSGSTDPGYGYVGADQCSKCHMQEFADWTGTRHSSAMATLQKVRRDRHANCVKCHVTGFGVDGGFSDVSRRAKLLGVQCEVCHGPGEQHAKSLKPEDIVLAPKPDTCLACHDAEHSDQFAGRFHDAYKSVSHWTLKR
jgi:hypothetical protein